MKLAVTGTRGIPNHYGGFEQFAEYLALGLAQKGHDVYVYNSHNHPYKDSMWRGVNIVHCFDPEYKLGTAGQFIYDFNCIINTRKRNFDIILQLGYTSSSVWGWLLPRRSIVVTNMDGLEWKRSKYSRPVRNFLKWAEGLAVRFSNHLIADSIGIQSYLSGKYKAPSVYIPYGACVSGVIDGSKYLDKYNVKAYNYLMLIARLEPENSIEIILDGMSASKTMQKFLVIGNHQTKFGNYLKEKYSSDKRIVFCGSVYDIEALNCLRYFSRIYFHGHTVGGTNPSLLEAMASNALIVAHDNEFNKAVLGEDAYYFNDVAGVSHYIDSAVIASSDNSGKRLNNIFKIKNLYSWDNIINQYESFFEKIFPDSGKNNNN